MIEFTKLIISGFCSISELELDLNTKGITIVRAPNGYGKSSIFSALVWGLYGKNLKGNSNVNTWKKSQPKKYYGTKVEVYFSTNSHIHRVIRCLRYTEEVDGAKGNSRLIYQVDGAQVDDKKKRGVQAIIEKDLGMSYNLFINSIMFGQGLKRLIQESGANQREVFEEVFELGYLSKAQKIAKDKYAESNSEYTSILRDLSHENQLIESLKSHIKDIKLKQESFEANTRDRATVLKNKVKKYKNQISSLRDELKGSDLSCIREEVRKTDATLQLSRKKLNSARAALGISLEELVDKIIKLLENKKYESSLSELKKLKEAFITQEVEKENIIKLQNQSAKLASKAHSISSKRDLLESLTEQLKSTKAQIKDVQGSVPDFKSLIDRDEKELSDLKEKTRLMIDKCNTVKDTTDIYHWAYTEPLGNTGIKSYLFNSCLRELNEVLDTYSDTLGFNIRIEVDLNSARKDFITTISLGGQEVPFDDLSGGQKQLASLAMAFSMNTLIAQAQGINIAFLDEVFESLSSDRIEIVVDLIKAIYRDKTLFLITHQESLPISNARVLKVKYDGKASTYEW